MATFSDIVEDVVNVSGSTAGTHYTVPSGFRAYVYVRRVVLTGGGATDTVSFGASTFSEVGGGNFQFPPDAPATVLGNESFLSNKIVLNDGDTIATTGTAVIDAVVEEYSNP